MVRSINKGFVIKSGMESICKHEWTGAMKLGLI